MLLPVAYILTFAQKVVNDKRICLNKIDIQMKRFSVTQTKNSIYFNSTVFKKYNKSRQIIKINGKLNSAKVK